MPRFQKWGIICFNGLVFDLRKKCIPKSGVLIDSQIFFLIFPMRKLRPHEIDNLQTLTKYSVESTIIEPTATGLGKSIMDATGQVRMYLKNKGAHDYLVQGLGGVHKVFVESALLTASEVVGAKASLYRPETKKGDPRIWITKLVGFANPNDILAIIYFEKKLNVINISKVDIASLMDSFASNPIKELIQEISGRSGLAAKELLGLLRVISARGPVQALLEADTSIGRTLETLLGININSSKMPDFKGIEIKSFRAERSNRKTLFAQVPDWKVSKFKSSDEILTNFGYPVGDVMQLNCTVSARSANSQGLSLNLDENQQLLFENSNIKEIGDFVAWSLEKLHERLLEKHNETFWISADSSYFGGNEYFHYKLVEHTKKPIVSQFDLLVSQGLITVDHLIKRKSLQRRANERGPLFKINGNAIGLLFPPTDKYDLTAP